MCWRFFHIWRLVGNVVRRLIDTPSSDHRFEWCMISAGRGGFLRLFQSKHAWYAFSQIRFMGELIVAQLDRWVFGFLPMCPSNGEIFVIRVLNYVVFLIFRLQPRQVYMLCLFYLFSSALMFVLTFGSFSLWSSTSAKINWCFLCWKNSWQFLALNDCAWSHFGRRGTSLLEICLCIIFMATPAVVFDTTFAVGNFDIYLLQLRCMRSFFSSSGRIPAKSNSILT